MDIAKAKGGKILVRIPRQVLAKVQAHARETYPEECCGFLIGRKDGDTRLVELSRRTPNVHPDGRETRYTIDNRAILAVEREFRGETQLIGIYHSHPDYPAKPSAFDTERAWPWYAYVIVAVVRGEPGDITAWELEEETRVFRSVPVTLAVPEEFDLERTP